jgi:hypothetical protein
MNELKNGIAEFSFVGLKEILPDLGNYGFFTVGGPSRAQRTLAQWDSLTFGKPVPPFPIAAEIFDRNGDGIGDSLRITYDKKLTGCSGCPGGLDSLPNYIEVFWDLSLEDTVGFGLATKNSNGEYENKTNGTLFSNYQSLQYWQNNHKIEQDSIIVIKCDDCFSKSIKTSVSLEEKDKIIVRSWTSFRDEKKVGAPWTTIASAAYIQSRIEDPTPVFATSTPKPFQVSGICGGIMFSNLPQNAKIGIYTLNGKAIYTGNAESSMQVNATPGAYIVRVKAQGVSYSRVVGVR